MTSRAGHPPAIGIGPRLSSVSDSAISARAAAAAAGGGLLLVVAAYVIPRWWYRDIDVEFAPLHASWDPKFPSAALATAAIGITMALVLPSLANRLPWRPLLGVAYG